MNIIGYHCGKQLYNSVIHMAFIFSIAKHKMKLENKSQTVLSSVLCKLNTVCSEGRKIKIRGVGVCPGFLKDYCFAKPNYIKIHTFEMSTQKLKSRSTLITHILIKLMLKKVLIPSREFQTL